jgi:hypothetical protein
MFSLRTYIKLIFEKVVNLWQEAKNPTGIINKIVMPDWRIAKLLTRLLLIKRFFSLIRRDVMRWLLSISYIKNIINVIKGNTIW